MYYECVSTVLNNRSAPNKQELVQSAQDLNQTLNNTGFFNTYDDFRQYRLRHHWRMVKYLDEETLVIAAAAREHFLSFIESKGINFCTTNYIFVFIDCSTRDFHFEWVPKESEGTRCGIICTVDFKGKREKFQVKTHHHGGSSLSNEPTRPNILELYCYKLFELIRVRLHCVSKV